MYIVPIPKPLEPTNIYAGCIAEFENIWPDSSDLILKIEDEINSNPAVEFEKAVVITKLDERTGHTETGISKHRTNSNLGIDAVGRNGNSDFFRELSNKFFLSTIAASEGYRARFKIAEPAYFVEGFNLLRYQGGEEYQAHYDGGTSSHRSLSPILYLNDDYTGGELEFVNFDLKIKPKAGSMYIFPSNYAYSHIAHPVETGTKYAIVTWLHDTPPLQN